MVRTVQSCLTMRNHGGDARAIRERLESRRIGLQHRYRATLDRVEEELADHSADVIDTATGQWDARVLDLMSEADAIALEQVIGALSRLDQGSYGVCVACDATIASARLALLPEVTLCARCARDAEQRRPRASHEVV